MSFDFLIKKIYILLKGGNQKILQKNTDFLSKKTLKLTASMWFSEIETPRVGIWRSIQFYKPLLAYYISHQKVLGKI